MVRIIPWFVIVAAVLSACGGAEPPARPGAPAASASQPPAHAGAEMTLPISTAPEMAFLPVEVQSGVEGAAVSVEGLYHVFDTSNRQVDVCHLQSAQSSCRRYPLDREIGSQPLAVSVKGTWHADKVTVEQWQALPFSWQDAMAECGRTFQAQVGPLSQIDWGAAAMAAYRETSARFKLDAAALASFTFEPAGFDPEQGKFVVRGKGPMMPEQNKLVQRWSYLYCIGTATPIRITTIVATIEGFAAEH